MSSNEARFSSGSKLRQYVLIEKLGDDQLGSAWTAQDSILGRRVAILILHASVASDRERLDLIRSEVRTAAHVDLPSIGKVYDLDHDGEVHFIVSEFIEGKSFASELRDVAVDFVPLVQIAITIAETLDHIHSQGMIHGNLHARHILVASDGRVRILGFGPGRGSSAHQEMQLAPGDIESAGYRSPEAVVGRAIDARSDVFAFGVLLYEIATGTRPFAGNTVEEIFDRILHAAPAAPHLINPAVESSIVAIIGRCIQKDPSRRHGSAGAILSDLRKIDPAPQTAVRTSGDPPEAAIEEPAETMTGATSELEIETVASRSAEEGVGRDLSARESLVLYAAISDGDTPLDETSKALAGRLQQILDETIYLADGRIIDPFAEQVIAEFEESFDALRAARKALHDLETYNSRQAGRAPTIDARLVVLRGDLVTVDGSLRGPAIEIARVVSRAIPPGKLAVSAEILSETGTAVTEEPLMTVAGRTFFAVSSRPSLVPPEPAPSAVPEVAPVISQNRRFGVRTRFLAIGALILLMTGLAAAALMVKRNAAAGREARRQADVTAEPAVAPPRAPVPISVEDVSVEGAFDSSLVQRAGSVRYAALGLVDSLRDFDVAARPHGNESRFAARLRQGTSGAELVPVRLSPELREGDPIPLNDQAAVSFANWIVSEMGSSRRFDPVDPIAMGHFSKAVAESTAQMTLPAPRTVASIREAVRADPAFLPAQLLAMDIFDRVGDRSAAIDAARRAVTLDPDDLALRGRLARWLYQSGDPEAAIAEFSELLARDRTDQEALTAVGLYALGVRDEARFSRVLARQAGPLRSRLLHEPDLLMASARIDQAASLYFDLEREQPDNAALALKIGRVAVIRHMDSIADIEVQKLEELDRSYGLPMLRAYIHAQNGRRTEAEAELKKAQLVAPWYAQPHTYGAEVYAILGLPARVLESLEMAAARGEPSGAYVLSNPLFRFVREEPRFIRLKSLLEAQQSAIRQALPSIPL